MPLFLKPVLKEKLWGGNRLSAYGYTYMGERMGECWCVSAHEHGITVITNGPYRNQTLDDVWQDAPYLFGDFPTKRFPLLTKIVDTAAPLSIQVHPHDSYAYEHENGAFGKDECWYILDAVPGAEILLGTDITNKAQVESLVHARAFDTAFRKIPVKAGDFFYLPAGTVHSIGEGITVFETQQSSDITYRIYDFERTDQSGQQRALHLEKALDVLNTTQAPTICPTVTHVNDHECTHFITTTHFSVERWMIRGTLSYMKPREFCLVTILDGVGRLIVDGEIYTLKQGHSFVLTAEDLDTIFEGHLTAMMSYV